MSLAAIKAVGREVHTEAVGQRPGVGVAPPHIVMSDQGEPRRRGKGVGCGARYYCQVLEQSNAPIDGPFLLAEPAKCRR